MQNVNEHRRPKVLVTHFDVPASGISILSEKCELLICTGKPSPTRNEILEKVGGVDAIFWVTHCRLDKEILDAAGPNLRSISTMSAGVDHLDVGEIKSRGISLGHTPYVLNPGVADCAVGLLIASARNFQQGHAQILKGKWETAPQACLGLDIYESTIGIVGLGGIGQAIAQRLKAFDVSTILYTGHGEKPEGKSLGAKYVTFDELLARSDFVIASCSLNSETKEMFNDSAFNKMKKSAIFINVSRGGVVHQPSLVKALSERTIYGAGLDVMTPEPLPADDPLIQLPNCFLQPHIGSATLKTRNDMATICAHNVLRGLAGEPMLSPV